MRTQAEIGKTDSQGFPGGLVAKNPFARAGATGDPGSIPESGRSPGEGSGYPLQYPCLESPLHRGAWRAIVHGVAELNRTEVTELTHTLPLNSAVVLPGSHPNVVEGRVPLLPPHSRSAGAPL